MLARRSVKLGTAWGASLVIHVTLAALVTAIALRAALESPPVPQRSLSFEDPGAMPVPEIEPTPSSPPASSDARPAPEQPEPAPADIDLPPEPADLAPASAPAPTGPLDAWLAPDPVPAGHATAQADNAAATSLPPSHRDGGVVRFAGLGSSDVRSVVYAVDASGPMVSSLPEVMAELDRSVSRLSASQRFGVVVFHRGQGNEPGAESFMPVLVRATAQAKKEMRAWIAGLQPSGRSNPLAGLRAALALKPEAVFLLSRGIERSGGGLWELGLDDTMNELDRLNPIDPRTGRRRVIIKTIQFLDEDPTGAMQQIGLLHGITHRRDGAEEPGYRVIRRDADLHTDDPLDARP